MGTLITIILVVAITFDMGGAIVALVKQIAEGAGWIKGVLKVIKGPIGRIVTFAVTLFSETEYQIPIESMSEEGDWTFETTATACEGVGGVVVPVDSFGLLAPYIGLASTITVATVATAIYVRRVKLREKKQ